MAEFDGIKVKGLKISQKTLKALASYGINEDYIKVKFSSSLSELEHEIPSGKIVNATVVLKDNSVLVLFARGNDIEFYLYNKEQDIVTRYLSADHAKEALATLNRLQAQALAIIDPNLSFNKRISGRDAEIIARTNIYINNPKHGPPDCARYDDDFCL